MLLRLERTADDGRDVSLREEDGSPIQLVEHRLEGGHLFGLVDLDLENAGDVGPIADGDSDVATNPADMADSFEVPSQCADFTFELRQQDRRSGRAMVTRLMWLAPLRGRVVVDRGGADMQIGERCLDPLKRVDGLRDRCFGHDILHDRGTAIAAGRKSSSTIVERGENVNTRPYCLGKVKSTIEHNKTTDQNQFFKTCPSLI